MSPPLSITAVDDHKLFLQGIAEYLQTLPFVKCVSTCTTYDDLLNSLKSNQPDIIFLDLNLPPNDGFSICEHVKRNYPSVFVAILTQYDSEVFVERAKKCGAGAYFVKNTDPEIFSYFLSCLLKGDILGFYTHIPKTFRPAIMFKKDDFELKELLSKREREIMKFLVKGVSSIEIEKTLNISYSTLKMHRTNILQKLHLHNVVELAMFSVNHGMDDNNS